MKQWIGLTGIENNEQAQPSPTVKLFYWISKRKKNRKNNMRICFQTFLCCDLSKFWTDLPNIAIYNCIQTNEIFDIFTISWFLCTEKKTKMLMFFFCIHSSISLRKLLHFFYFNCRKKMCTLIFYYSLRTFWNLCRS